MADKEYIERGALLKDARHDKAIIANLAGIADIANLIYDQPAADVVEVRHGEWKPDLHYIDGHPYKDEWYGYIFKCSVCNGTTMGGYDLECDINYCPHCGADMRGEKNG